MASYAATFSAVPVTAAQDVFEIVAPATKRVRIRELRLSQYSDAGDAAAELLSLLVVRGYTTTGSGGSAATPRNLNGSSTRTAASTVATNNTGLAANGTAHTMLADSWNVQAGAWAAPDMIYLAPSTRLVVRITAPADSLTMSGTLIFEEVELDKG